MAPDISLDRAKQRLSEVSCGLLSGWSSYS